MDCDQLRMLIIRPTLTYLDMWSEAAENLLLGTASQESRLGHYIRQIGCTGDTGAYGIYQMELATETDIWGNYLKYRDDLKTKVYLLCAHSESDTPRGFDLITNTAYATAQVRVHYLRVPEALPDANDIEGLANYWKKHYNTEMGKGTVEEFIENYKRYVCE